jgi:hypothetical protein
MFHTWKYVKFKELHLMFVFFEMDNTFNIVTDLDINISENNYYYEMNIPDVTQHVICV